jgi:hypothetical protein
MAEEEVPDYDLIVAENEGDTVEVENVSSTVELKYILFLLDYPFNFM